MRKLPIAVMGVLIIGVFTAAWAGTSFIPIWQHGLGVTYLNSIINTDTKSATCTLKLYDLVCSITISTTRTVAPMDAWISDTHRYDGWFQKEVPAGLL